MANASVVKIVDELKKFVNIQFNKLLATLNTKIATIRVGEDNIVAGAVTAKTIAANAVTAQKIITNAIESRHLSISAKNSIPTLNRNYIRNGNEAILSSVYLIAEYETSELLEDFDYTIVVYGLTNEGQQILVKYNDGVDGTDVGTFTDGYAVIHTHTPDVLENENIRFYNYPEATATTASIGWVCMYRDNITSPPMYWNIAPEDTGVRIDDTTSSIELLGDAIELKVSTADLETYLYFSSSTGLSIGKSDSPLKIFITNDRISFKESGSEVAYITGSTLYITSAEITSEQKIGNYIITKTTDGGMVFK